MNTLISVITNQLTDITMNYLTIKDCIDLQIPITPRMLQHKLPLDITSLINIPLNEVNADMFAAYVLMYGVPETYFEVDPTQAFKFVTLYEDLPSWLRFLVIDRSINRYTDTMFNNIVKAIGGTWFSLKDLDMYDTQTLRLITEYGLTHNRHLDYRHIMSIAIRNDITSIIVQLLPQNSLVTVEGLKTLLQYGSTLAYPYFQRLWEIGSVSKELLLKTANDYFLHQFLNDPKMYKSMTRGSILSVVMQYRPDLIPAIVTSPYFNRDRLLQYVPSFMFTDKYAPAFEILLSLVPLNYDEITTMLKSAQGQPQLTALFTLLNNNLPKGDNDVKEEMRVKRVTHPKYRLYEA